MNTHAHEQPRGWELTGRPCEKLAVNLQEVSPLSNSITDSKYNKRKKKHTHTHTPILGLIAEFEMGFLGCAVLRFPRVKTAVINLRKNTETCCYNKNYINYNNKQPYYNKNISVTTTKDTGSIYTTKKKIKTLMGI